MARDGYARTHNPVKMFHRSYKIGFSTIIFKNKQHYLNCKIDYDKKYHGLDAKNIKNQSDIYKGIRHITQTEAERLQTVPEGYTKILKENDAINLLGDGWTVDVIAHIFKGISH